MEREGVFARMMAGLVTEADKRKTVMIDATYLKAHRTASSLRSERVPAAQKGRLIGRTKDSLNTKLHAVADGDGRSIQLFLTAQPGQRPHRRPGHTEQLAQGRLADRGPRP